MRALSCFLPILLLGAAPQPLPTVPLGAFQTWGIHPETPISFVSGGLKVEVSATPCQVPGQNEGCRSEGRSNQAVVTVSQPGLPPFQMTSDPQASFVRVAVIRFGPDPRRSAVVVDNQWGGSRGLTAVTIIEPVAGGFGAVPLKYNGSTELLGEVKILPQDLLKDTRPGFVLETYGFNYSGECNACTRGVPLVLTVRSSRSVDISADPVVRSLFERDLPNRRRACISTEKERNGDCAAFVADAARLGQVASAWGIMLSHYRPEPAGYPAALRSYLIGEGYITPAEARRLPLQ